MYKALTVVNFLVFLQRGYLSTRDRKNIRYRCCVPQTSRDQTGDIIELMGWIRGANSNVLIDNFVCEAFDKINTTLNTDDRHLKTCNYLHMNLSFGI